ncbi:MAG: Ni/Fe hydrogenase subunit alpha [Candidatus Hadarchaeia archaeon]
MRKEVIEPVTRVEGHGKITIHLNENEEVEDARFHVTEFRGFEKFVQGRPYWEMPDMTSRICGICPVSHHLAAAKACDSLLEGEIPRPAEKLRELMHMGQILQSHALSFFYLSSPDLLLGYDEKPSRRNIKGILESEPELAKRGVRLRSFGQEVIESLGGKRVHPEFAIPGGVTNNLDESRGKDLLENSEPLVDFVTDTIDKLRAIYEDMDEEMLNYATYQTGYLGLVDENSKLELYDGRIKLVDETGKTLENIAPSKYSSIIDERSKKWTYLKFPYYLKKGFEDGQYRSGPLARLNVADRIGTELAQREFERYMDMAEDRVQEKTIFYHYARLIDMLYCVERIQQLLEDSEVYNGKTNFGSELARKEGIGVIEAPRGNLIHHYKVDGEGLVEDANMIIPTTHNNPAMNRGIQKVAERFINGPEISEEVLNKIESAIRCYDPCLSCSTHALGQMPLDVKLLSPDGNVLDSAVNSPGDRVSS